MLTPDHLIPDQRGEARWRLAGKGRPLPGSSPFLRLWPVEDLRLERRLSLLTLHYQEIPQERLFWDVPALRKAFHRLVHALSPNHLCLPEPIDLFTFSHPTLPDELAPNEPALVLADPPGARLWPFSRIQYGTTEKHLRDYSLHLAYALRDLHRNGCLARALPLAGIFRHPVTRAVSIASFQSLCRFQDFQGFSRHEAGLHPPETHAAPECFATSGHLTPATDVYALACLLWEAFDEPLSPTPPNPDEIEEFAHRHQLESFWLRFFKLALHSQPDCRFSGMQEVILYINSRGTAGVPGSSSSSRPARRTNATPSAAPSPRPRTRRPDAPPAALLIWNEFMTERHRRFNYHRFLAHCQRRYSLRPLLLFAREQADMNNSFFQLLRKLSFEIVSFRPGASPHQIVADAASRWQSAPHLVLAGNTGQEGTLALLAWAQENKLSVELYPTAGPSLPDVKIHDVTPFLQENKSAAYTGGARTPSHRRTRKRKR